MDVRLSDAVDKALGAVFVTPNIHRLHHSASQPQTDSNFGAGLIIWDRLFGTFRSPLSEQVERVGLGDSHDPGAQNLWHQLCLPFTRNAESEPVSQ